MDPLKKSISRRRFLNQTIGGVSALAITPTSAPLVTDTRGTLRPATIKKLFATTDYRDNVLINNRFMDRTQLDSLHRGLASLGVTRHQWIVDTIWSFYEKHPYGLDLLTDAVESAHKHGIEFYAVIKPFEGVGFGTILPNSMPFPKNAPAFKDLRGIFPIARPFAARHPDMCLKRRPGTFEFRGPVKSIRLVKDNASPTRIKAEHLSIWTSTTNNRFVRYMGPVAFRESVEWRPCFPKLKRCRVLYLEDLEIPKDHAYILIRCDGI